MLNKTLACSKNSCKYNFGKMILIIQSNYFLINIKVGYIYITSYLHYNIKCQGIFMCILSRIKVVKLNPTTFFEIIGRCHKKRAQDKKMDTCMQGNEKSENYSNKLFTTRKSLVESFLSFKSQLSLNCFVLEDTYIERRVFKLFATENERYKKQKILIRCTAYKI